jgi:acyl transferase domain-containing protein
MSGPTPGASAERSVPIAVVGLAALMPGARDAAEFWRNIVAGRDLITDVPPGHWPDEGFYDPDPATPDTTYSRRGAFLPEIEFDPLAHGLPPATLPAVDPAQLLGLAVADALLADLGRNLAGPLGRERVSVILGSSTLSRVGTMDARIQRPLWLKALREQGVPESQAHAICERIAAQYVPWQEATFPGLLSNVVAGRIANRLDLHGTNCTVDAACASSLAAVAAAVNELSLGKADLAVTGGVDATNNPLMYVCFSKTPALSPTGDARPFSEDADGTMLGEGLGMLGLKRLDTAERDGDRVYAVIRGVGSSSDGRGGAIYAPMPEGQVRALRRAYEAAGYGPGTVELVEAHGTATRAGDAAEFESLRRVFGESGRPGTQWCALGTVKSQIGHTKAAAGAAGLIKAVLALHHRVLPPTIKVRRPNPEFGIDDSPFYLNTAARPWTRGADHERRASVSSFGFGGANYHVAVEEHRRGGDDDRGLSAPRFRVAPSELLLFGADSARELRARLRDGVDGASARPVLPDLARETQREFDAERPVRLAVVASDEDDLRAKLDQATAMLDRQPDQPFSLPGGVFYRCGATDPGRIAFVFPGQGAQYVGMGSDVAMAFPLAQDVWDLAAGLDLGERGLHEVVFPPPAFSDDQRAAQERRLTDTRWAQPALAAHSLSLLALLTALGIEPACVAGHSLGELVALHAAGAMDAESLLRLARHRGELLAGMGTEPGAMLAISAGEAAVAATIDASRLADVWLANINAPTQTVVSGSVHAIEELHERFSGTGTTARRLAVSAAFHSPMARTTVAPLREFLGTLDLTAPRIDVYSNADARIYGREPDAIRDRLAAHPAAPVRFRDQVEAMYDAGVRTFVEVGAGSTLTGLIGQILDGREHAAVSLDKRGRDGVTAWHEALGRLAVRGVRMDLAKLSQGWISALPEPVAQTNQPRMSVRIDGTGYSPPQPSPQQPPKPALQSATQPSHPVVSTPAVMEPAPAMSEHEPAESAPPTPIAAVHKDVPAESSAGWLAAVQEMQRQTAEAHMHFQRVLGDAHQAFLQMAENTFAAFVAPGTVSVAAPTQTAAIAPPALPALPTLYTTPAPPPSQIPAPVPMPRAPEPQPVPLPTFEQHSPEPELAAPHETVDLDLLLSVVADKTGYPADMLNGGMDLETDLGIDSIKKVEILAAVRQRAEGLPPTDSPQMSRLFQARTLDEIVQLAADTDGSAPPEQAIGDKAENVAAPTVVVRRLQVRPMPAPACGLAMTGLGHGPISVIDGGSGLASAVTAHLAAHGIAATIEDAPAPDAWGVILLGGMAPVADPQQATSAHRLAFQAARSVAASMEKRGGVFVTVHDTGGCFGLVDPDPARAWLGGLAALARTAAREWPQASVKAIDCQRADRDKDALAAAIVAELLTGGSTLNVGLRADGSRWTVIDVEAAAVPSADRLVTPDSILVASGGARGVTAAALLALAAANRPRMLLIGRTTLTDSQLTDEPAFLATAHDEPSLTRLLAERERAEGGTPSTPARLAAQARTFLARREIRATLAGLKRAGATARYACVDVTDRDALDRELSRVRQEWGPITGLVHGAGVIADRRIAEKTDEQFDHVYATKVVGLRALLDATADDPVELLCVFSSVAGRYGNPGQCDYAMANEVLNQVACAERLRRPSCRVRALGWGPWEAGMVTASHAAHFAGLGVPLIPLDAGARAFLDEIGADDDAVQVLLSAASDGAGMASDRPRFAVEASVDARSHGFLADHAPADVPVLPLALAMEWFAAAGRSQNPDRPTALSEISVLNKAELPDLDTTGHRFTIEGHEDERGPGIFELRLTSSTGITHCRARLVAPDTAPQLWTAPTVVPEVLTEESIYENSVLFHGPGFCALRRVEGMSPEGAEAQVVGVRALGWPEGPWWTDPAAIDGALQAAVLWARHVTGDATLPMSVDALRIHRAGPAPEVLRCLVRAATSTADQTRCDVALFDQDGEVRAELFGVSLIRRPDMASVAAAAVSARPGSV